MENLYRSIVHRNYIFSLDQKKINQKLIGGQIKAGLGHERATISWQKLGSFIIVGYNEAATFAHGEHLGINFFGLIKLVASKGFARELVHNKITFFGAKINLVVFPNHYVGLETNELTLVSASLFLEIKLMLVAVAEECFVVDKCFICSCDTNLVGLADETISGGPFVDGHIETE